MIVIFVCLMCHWHLYFVTASLLGYITFFVHFDHRSVPVSAHIGDDYSAVAAGFCSSNVQVDYHDSCVTFVVDKFNEFDWYNKFPASFKSTQINETFSVSRFHAWSIADRINSFIEPKILLIGGGERAGGLASFHMVKFFREMNPQGSVSVLEPFPSNSPVGQHFTSSGYQYSLPSELDIEELLSTSYDIVIIQHDTGTIPTYYNEDFVAELVRLAESSMNLLSKDGLYLVITNMTRWEASSSNSKEFRGSNAGSSDHVKFPSEDIKESNHMLRTEKWADPMISYDTLTDDELNRNHHVVGVYQRNNLESLVITSTNSTTRSLRETRDVVFAKCMISSLKPAVDAQLTHTLDTEKSTIDYFSKADVIDMLYDTMRQQGVQRVVGVLSFGDGWNANSMFSVDVFIQLMIDYVNMNLEMSNDVMKMRGDGRLTEVVVFPSSVSASASICDKIANGLQHYVGLHGLSVTITVMQHSFSFDELHSLDPNHNAVFVTLPADVTVLAPFAIEELLITKFLQPNGKSPDGVPSYRPRDPSNGRVVAVGNGINHHITDPLRSYVAYATRNAPHFSSTEEQQQYVDSLPTDIDSVTSFLELYYNNNVESHKEALKRIHWPFLLKVFPDFYGGRDMLTFPDKEDTLNTVWNILDEYIVAGDIDLFHSSAGDVCKCTRPQGEFYRCRGDGVVTSTFDLMALSVQDMSSTSIFRNSTVLPWMSGKDHHIISLASPTASVIVSGKAAYFQYYTRSQRADVDSGMSSLLIHRYYHYIAQIFFETTLQLRSKYAHSPVSPAPVPDMSADVEFHRINSRILIDHGYAVRLYESNSDINEHLPIIQAIAQCCCWTVGELGIRDVKSSWAFARGLLLRKENEDSRKVATSTQPEQPLRMWMNDLQPLKDNIFLRLANAVGISASFVQHDDLTVDISEEVQADGHAWDAVFIDTWHIYGQLRQELALYQDKARKFLILHDTETFGEFGEIVFEAGLQAIKTHEELRKRITELTVEHGRSEEDLLHGEQRAVDEFLIAQSGTWMLARKYHNNNGLTVLCRVQYCEDIWHIMSQDLVMS